MINTRYWFAALALTASHQAMADYAIGVSMSQFDDAWLTVLRHDLLAAAKAHPDGVTLQFVDARADVNRQVDQVQDLISKKVDALIVNPVDTAATAKLTEAATRAGIPLVYVNRRPDQQNLPANVVTVTSDEVEAGQMQARYLVDQLHGQGDIVILLGDLANNATHNRTLGVQQVLARNPGIKVIEQQSGAWQRQRGMDLTNDWLTQGRAFSAVLSYNDEMGIGAAMALKQAGIDKGRVLVTGSDGTSDGLYAVKSGELAVSLYQDAMAQAQGSIQAAIQLAQGKGYAPQNVLIPYRLITRENVNDWLASPNLTGRQ